MTDQILNISKRGLEAAEEKVKAMTSNLVNAQTPGFRKSEVAVKSFPAYLEDATQAVENSSSVPKAGPVTQSHQQGALFKTGNPTDIAIGGKGYFVLQGPEGDIYTRDGRFTLDENGVIVSVVGNHPLMARGGQVAVIPGARIDISQSGVISVDDTPVDQVRVVEFSDPSRLRSINGTHFSMPSEGASEYFESESPRVIQGFVEGSNVSIMDSMMDMIYLSRLYAVDAKVITAREAALAKALEMGRPSQ